MMAYGRGLSQSPFSSTVMAGLEIPACVLRVKQIWIVFHDAGKLIGKEVEIKKRSVLEARSWRTFIVSA
jgi:hypothetical protein